MFVVPFVELVCFKKINGRLGSPLTELSYLISSIPLLLSVLVQSTYKSIHIRVKFSKRPNQGGVQPP